MLKYLPVFILAKSFMDALGTFVISLFLEKNSGKLHYHRLVA